MRGAHGGAAVEVTAGANRKSSILNGIESIAQLRLRYQ
jgi:hypothetical protein